MLGVTRQVAACLGRGGHEQAFRSIAAGVHEEHPVGHDLATGTAQGNFTERFSAEIQNGEGIVGYQYLHGTNRDAGDFGFEGTTNVRPRGDGT